MDGPRHGWSYSIFASVVACVVPASSIASTPADKLGSPQSIAIIAFVAVSAFLSARIGTYCARLSRHNSDHGLLAGGYTALIFSLSVGLYFVGREYFFPAPFTTLWKGTALKVMKDVVAFFFLTSSFASVVAIPASIVGTVLFNAALYVAAKARAFK
jgi:hypothetical protein